MDFGPKPKTQDQAVATFNRPQLDQAGLGHAEWEASRFKRFIIWAGADELTRLRRLHGDPRQNDLRPFPVELTRPRRRLASQQVNDTK